MRSAVAILFALAVLPSYARAQGPDTLALAAPLARAVVDIYAANPDPTKVLWDGRWTILDEPLSRLVAIDPHFNGVLPPHRRRWVHTRGITITGDSAEVVMEIGAADARESRSGWAADRVGFSFVRRAGGWCFSGIRMLRHTTGASAPRRRQLDSSPSASPPRIPS
jgi:hypothetical protein